MLIRHYAPSFTKKLNKPLRIFSVVFLVLIIVGAIAKERAHILEYLTQVGLATVIFCICSLMIGYFVPRLLGINSAQARACAFEIGIHNSTLAMTIALDRDGQYHHCHACSGLFYFYVYLCCHLWDITQPLCPIGSNQHRTSLEQM